MIACGIRLFINDNLSDFISMEEGPKGVTYTKRSLIIHPLKLSQSER